MSQKNKIQNYINLSDAKGIYALAGTVFLVALMLLGWFIYKVLALSDIDEVAKSDIVPNVQEEKDCEFKRKIDGVCVELEKYTDTKLVAVMIENNLEAWPLSGLAEASVVYEAPVEGNIPRFMAIYALDEKVDQVGPVRSARPYYLDWVSEYGNTMYMHVGGSPDSLDLIDKYNLFDLNEFYRGWYFWRSLSRSAPHNTYTSTDLWTKAYEKYSEYYVEVEKGYEGWTFNKIEECVEECIGKIDIPIAPWSSYHAVWKFNTSTQKYTRFQGGEQMFEMDSKEIFADTVVVQKVKSKVIDNIGRKEIETIGKGDVFIFRNGKVFEGQWEKESRKGRTVFYDESGEVIPLQAGKIWIEVLPMERKLEWE